MLHAVNAFHFVLVLGINLCVQVVIFRDGKYMTIKEVFEILDLTRYTLSSKKMWSSYIYGLAFF